MKRILLIFSLISLIFISTACTSDQQNPIMIKDANVNAELLDDVNIEFEIENIILSKGFQNLEAKVEVLKRDDGFRLLASLGLLNTSGISVNNIEKSGDEINIYVENISSRSENQLAIPQIMIDLKNVKLRNIENAKFNIINENYTPIKVKLSPNEVINKVNSDFQIITHTSPNINIIQHDDSYLWVLDYKNILDKYNLETPVVDMSVTVDANSGDLVQSSKNFISYLIDEGSILDYAPSEHILYKREERALSSEAKWINLISYDINTGNKKVLYSTNLEIIDARYSPDLNSIAILESNDTNNQLYILARDDSKAYRVVASDMQINPLLIRWENNSSLYILNKTVSTSSIYKYNIEENTTSLMHYFYSDIVGLQVQGDDVIITIKDKDTDQNSIFMTSNWITFDLEEEGHTPRFLTDTYIGFTRFNEQDTASELVLVDKDNYKKYDVINLNVTNYFSISDDTIGIISTNQNNNDYTFHKYHIKSKDLEKVANIISDKVYYDSNNELLYIDFRVSFESSKSQIIFSLNLEKIDTSEPLVR